MVGIRIKDLEDIAPNISDDSKIYLKVDPESIMFDENTAIEARKLLIKESKRIRRNLSINIIILIFNVSLLICNLIKAFG